MSFLCTLTCALTAAFTSTLPSLSISQMEALTEQLGLSALTSSTNDVLVHTVETSAGAAGGGSALALRHVPLDVRIFPCSVLRGTGCAAPLHWLAARV